MENTRVLNVEEKCELISALANARVNNSKKAKNFRSASQDAHHKQDAADLAATAERYEMWAQLDEALIDAIANGQIFIEAEEE
jgi:transposase